MWRCYLKELLGGHIMRDDSCWVKWIWTQGMRLTGHIQCNVIVGRVVEVAFSAWREVSHYVLSSGVDQLGEADIAVLKK